MNPQQVLKQTFEHTRTYFPSLGTSYKGHPVLFFDNSAGAQVSQFVIDRVTDYYIHRNAQKGTIFARTEEMQQVIVEARQLAAEFVGAADHTEIAFGQNATNFFHLFAHHLGRDLVEGDHIIITEADHQANVSPWLELEERGIHVHLWQVDTQGNLDFEHYEPRSPARRRGCSAPARRASGGSRPARPRPARSGGSCGGSRGRRRRRRRRSRRRRRRPRRGRRSRRERSCRSGRRIRHPRRRRSWPRRRCRVSG